MYIISERYHGDSVLGFATNQQELDRMLRELEEEIRGEWEGKDLLGTGGTDKLPTLKEIRKLFEERKNFVRLSYEFTVAAGWPNSWSIRLTYLKHNQLV